MLSRRVLPLFLLFVVWLTPGCGRSETPPLGPVDGEGLRPDDMDRVAVGSPAPDFTLRSVDGEPVTLSSFRGKKEVILIFYRGHW